MIDPAERVQYIELVPPSADWPQLFISAANEIRAILQDNCIDIHHIGSTAIPSIYAKPVIDIIIAIKSIEDARSWVTLLEILGYKYWDGNLEKNHLRFFKGMPPYGEKRTHHIHIIDASNITLEQRIIFRNILRQDEKSRLVYQSLKLESARQHHYNRGAYTQYKTDFIKNTLYAHGYIKSIAI